MAVYSSRSSNVRPLPKYRKAPSNRSSIGDALLPVQSFPFPLHRPVHLVKLDLKKWFSVFILRRKFKHPTAGRHDLFLSATGCFHGAENTRHGESNKNQKKHPAPNISIRKMSGMFHLERHVCVVLGNKTPSREVFFQSWFLLSQSEENNTKNENIM
jgi:hypothetical protein